MKYTASDARRMLREVGWAMKSKYAGWNGPVVAKCHDCGETRTHSRYSVFLNNSRVTKCRACPSCLRTRRKLASQANTERKREVKQEAIKRRAEAKRVASLNTYQKLISKSRVRVVSGFTKIAERAEHKCLQCKHVWWTTPAIVSMAVRLNTPTQGCPECKRRRYKTLFTLTHTEYVARLRKLESSWIPLGHFVSGEVRIAHQCSKCLYQVTIRPSRVMAGAKCQQCSAGFYLRKEYKLGRALVYVQGFEPLALDILRKKLKPTEIKVQGSGLVPSVHYHYAGRRRVYLPDFYVPKSNRLIEVKSIATFGLVPYRGHKPSEMFYKNAAKARAVLAEGYRYTMMVFSDDRKLVRLPPNWMHMTFTQVRAYIKSTKAP